MRRYSKSLTVAKYVASAVIALVFMLYYLVGYNEPAPWDDRYNAPVLTDLLILTMALLLVLSLVAVMFSVARSAKVNKEQRVVNGVRALAIRYSVGVCVVVLMIGTFALMPTDEILVNGSAFDDTLWLRAANMFVVSSVVLMIGAVGAIVFGLLKNKRKSDAAK